MELINPGIKPESGVLYVLRDGQKQDTRHSLSPNRMYRMPAGFSQRISLPLFYHKGQGIYISKLFLYFKVARKKKEDFIEDEDEDEEDEEELENEDEEPEDGSGDDFFENEEDE